MVTRAQLERAGITRHGIAHRLRIGALYRLRGGLYLGPGFIVQRPTAIDPGEIRLRHGLPVTSPARTLVDVAALASSAELEGIVAEARVQRLLRPGELEAAARPRVGDEAPRACARSCEPSTSRRSRAGRPRSACSRSCARRSCRRRSSTAACSASRSTSTGRRHGWWSRSTGIAFTDTAQRSSAIAAATTRWWRRGYRVMRFTWRQLTREPLAVVARLAMALALAVR